MSRTCVVRVQAPVWEAILDVPGDAGSVAAQLRKAGLLARKVGLEVIVNANHIPPGMK